MLVTNEPVRLDIPHEKGQWFDIKSLSWKQLRIARKLVEEEQREIAKSFGAEFMAALTKGNVDDARKVIREQQYNVVNFDMGLLLEQGVVAWSYPEKIDVDTIEQLDERTAVWAAQQIIDLTKPLSESEEKNSSSDYIEL